MASITIGNSNGAGVNPTNLYLPVNNDGIFVDSLLQQDDGGDILKINPMGVFIDTANSIFILGDFDDFQNQTRLTVDDNAQRIALKTVSGEILLDVGDSGEILFSGAGLIDPIAGAPSANNLLITINGVQYKIPLFT